jgi:hypothetical protein
MQGRADSTLINKLLASSGASIQMQEGFRKSMKNEIHADVVISGTVRAVD